MNRPDDERPVRFEIPARTISGSVPELLEELDDMIDALRTVRSAVVSRAPRPARPARNGWRSGPVGRALQKLHLL